MELGQSLCFDDVLMEPLYSNIATRSTISLETNIGTNGRNLILKTPLISSPMDTVTEKDMAIKMALSGGLGIIHRYMDIDEQVQNITKVKRFLQYIIQEPYRIIPSTTYNEIVQLSEKYNVSSFCIVSTMESNKFVGLITRRDIEYMKYLVEQRKINFKGSSPELTVAHMIESKRRKIITLDVRYHNIDKSLDNTLTKAKKIELGTRYAEEVEQMDERELSKGETAEKERIVKGMKKSLAGFKSRYGERAKEVMYATATKQAKKD